MTKKTSSFDPAAAKLKVLFAASEVQPLIKTGGLADVAGSLPPALRASGCDIRVILPAYPDAVERAIPLKTVATIPMTGVAGDVRLLEGTLAEETPVYLVDAPGLFDRRGNPYTNPNGQDWGDNAQRFSLFSRVIAAVAMNRAELHWRPQVVHCNDWQTGLAPALLAQEWDRPATLFTIHNLSYQGIFDSSVFAQLQLPKKLWSPQGLEFHENLSFIKGGLVFADTVTTVSPTYAKEILTPQFGYGLEGLLNHRADRLFGVLNGIDYNVWNPTLDPVIPHRYDSNDFGSKLANKLALQQELGLEQAQDVLLFGHIGRMVEQKGIDLVLEILPTLMEREKVQLVVLGSGDPRLEQALQSMAEHYPGRCCIRTGYDEALAHRIEAGCDAFLMPSRYEPCGLNQLYSLRYGTVPIVHRTGGLADTVVDVNPASLLDGSATGFVFEGAQSDALLEAIDRTIAFFRRPGVWWHKLATTGMKQDFSWDASARHYLELYREAMDHPAPNPVA